MDFLLVSPFPEVLAPSDTFLAEPFSVGTFASAATPSSGTLSETSALATTVSLTGVLLGPLLKVHLYGNV